MLQVVPADISPQLREVITRLVVLCQVPREQWAEEDHRLLRDLRDLLKVNQDDRSSKAQRVAETIGFKGSGSADGGDPVPIDLPEGSR